MKYGSVCSGIEAATVAWHDLGLSASWFSEIEKFPSQVLQHHYPDILNLGDMTLIRDKVKSGEVEALGNSMAVPVMRWIGERLLQVFGEAV